MSILKYKKLYPWAKTPSKAHSDDAGFDLFISDEFEAIELLPRPDSWDKYWPEYRIAQRHFWNDPPAIKRF